MSETLDARLVEVSARWPDAIAVRHGDRSLTFAALADRAGRLAGWLQSQGVVRGDRVAIQMRRSIEMAVAVYGVMRAGAAYVPIDPMAPPERIAGILNDSGAEVMITEDALAGQIADALPGTGVRCVLGLSADAGGVSAAPFDAVETAPHFVDDHGPDDICYVIFTSGSTGTPKGLTHTHASALSFVDMAAPLFGLGPHDVMAATSGLHYDMSCMEMFAGLLSGARILMVPETHMLFPASLSALLEAEGVTTIYSVPFMLIRLVEGGGLADRDLTALRLVIHAGEPMPARPIAELRAHLPAARFSNFYGPAEVNGVTWWDHPEQPAEDITDFPIGYACAHTELLVDGDDGVEGELLIATPAMMQGYWRRPDLDDRSFETRPGRDGTLRRFYRSGDVVRRDARDCYVFVGRADRQVKLRGHRVELDEVEMAICAHAAVSEAGAVLTPDGLSIRAFVTMVPGASATPQELLSSVGERLPRHAVPDRIEIIETFPRTSSGKIDRPRLAEAAASRQTETHHEPSR
ncbi:amino acid adenylation domain-containing protein [Rhodobacterales bacterium HKCCE3408]|nr:amino acid adenylation domain-containing protein [Rhodobacterales bacterium HKCCE3408]